MANCGPSCTIPSCASTPIVGLGSTGCRGIGWSSGGLGWGYGGHGHGYAETSGNLGTLPGVIPSCVNQTPPAEVVIQPPPCVVTLPGAILSSSCQPVTVGGNTPCAIGGSGIIGSGSSGGYGSGRGIYGGYIGCGLLGRRRGSVCLLPC